MNALVAEYVYLGAHVHMFVRGNFSLVMAHANYILSTQGLHGISHGNLDYIALVNSLDYFRAKFNSELRKVNPGLSSRL